MRSLLFKEAFGILKGNKRLALIAILVIALAGLGKIHVRLLEDYSALETALAARPKTMEATKEVKGPVSTKRTRKFKAPVCPEVAKGDGFGDAVLFEEVLETRREESTKETRSESSPAPVILGNRKARWGLGVEQDDRKRTELNLGYDLGNVSVYAGPRFDAMNQDVGSQFGIFYWF
jgi:hypothetical protein